MKKVCSILNPEQGHKYIANESTTPLNAPSSYMQALRHFHCFLFLLALPSFAGQTFLAPKISLDC